MYRYKVVLKLLFLRIAMVVEAENIDQSMLIAQSQHRFFSVESSTKIGKAHE